MTSEPIKKNYLQLFKLEIIVVTGANVSKTTKDENISTISAELC